MQVDLSLDILMWYWDTNMQTTVTWSAVRCENYTGFEKNMKKGFSYPSSCDDGWWNIDDKKVFPDRLISSCQ